MYYQQPQPLPFPTDRLLYQPININYGQPPVLPQIGYPLPQYLANFYPLLVSVCIDNIQSKSNQNALRVFTFNQLAANSYNNQEFSMLVEYCVRVLDMQMQKRMHGDIQSAISTVVPMCVGHKCAENVNQYPTLLQFMDQHSQSGIPSVLQQMNTVKFELNGGGQPMHQPQQQHFQMQQMQQRFQQNYPQGNFLNSAAIPSNRPSLISNTGGYNNIVNNQPVVKEYGYAPMPIAQPAISNTPVNNTNNKSSTSGIVWIPSEKYPLTIAYDPNIQIVSYVRDGNSVKPDIQINSGNNMDINKHFIKPSFAPVDTIAIPISDSRSRGHDLQQNMPKQELLTENSDDCSAFISLQEAMFIADLNLMELSQCGQKTNLYNSLAFLVTPLISRFDLKIVMTELGNIVNFSTMHKSLTELKNELGVKIDHVSLANLDRKLTKEVNDFLSKKLAVTVKIDSFLEDGKLLIDYIKGKYGDAHARALEANQTTILNSFTKIAWDKLKQTLDQQYVDSATISSNQVAFLLDPCTVSTVNMFSTELKLELPETLVSCAVLEKFTPLFYDIAKNIFDYTDKQNLINSKHYLKTLDGVIYELTKGALNNDFILVCVIK